VAGGIRQRFERFPLPSSKARVTVEVYRELLRASNPSQHESSASAICRPSGGQLDSFEPVASICASARKSHLARPFR